MTTVVVEVVNTGVQVVEVVAPAVQLVEVPTVVGPRGPTGPAATRTGLRQIFATPAAQWVWAHGLGVRPHVVATVDGEVVIPDIAYPDDNSLIVTLDAPAVGYLDIA